MLLAWDIWQNPYVFPDDTNVNSVSSMINVNERHTCWWECQPDVTRTCIFVSVDGNASWIWHDLTSCSSILMRSKCVDALLVSNNSDCQWHWTRPRLLRILSATAVRDPRIHPPRCWRCHVATRSTDCSENFRYHPAAEQQSLLIADFGSTVIDCFAWAGAYQVQVDDFDLQ